ncbi:hypothetical protein ASE63_18740 [Bosea sp. Root381]|uniref:hypothetical protein n=1 Tax=Bosea sp. Root381 TaxID=1736524 RepID=UPI0006FBF994|nr:hypothetical protein [Bosea sp. Root381]KRE13505.1 hypothetical protein ASE63_18740 [Bosea sp. Root381]
MTESWLFLLLFKMAIAAGIVVSCSLIAERSGPLVAALIATLPISLGPVYVFLALDHDAAFIADAALGSMASTVANGCLFLVYVLRAQKHATLASLGPALLVWLVAVFALYWLEPSFWTLLGLTLAVFIGAHLAVRPYLAARSARPAEPPWFAIPLRALCVAALAGTATTASAHVGGVWSGVLAGLPIVMSSLVLILQPRIGGPAAAAVIANSVIALLGFGLAISVVHLAAVPLGSWPALGVGLLICVVWNLGLMALSRRAAP